jgi:hypothetical protein
MRYWLKNTAISAVLAAFVYLSWTGTLDTSAQSGVQSTLTRALATWAIARGLNGVISVAQGTEIAIQPVGIGITLTVGEILDPLNDLIERFSWLAMAASASLGTQALLTELLANPWMSWVLSVAAGVYALSLWWPRSFPGRVTLLRCCMIAVFARFLVAVITLSSAWVDEGLLADRQQAAMNRMNEATENIEALQQDMQPQPPADSGVLRRFGDLLDETSQMLDIQNQLQTLKQRVETTIAEVLNLMVLFIVQTLILPIGGLLIAYWAFKWFWRWTWTSSA